MAAPRAVIFDLGGTLVHWSDWETGADRKWANSYDHLVTQFADRKWPARDAYVNAMRDAEREHWRRVDTEHWSGPPTGLVREAFDRLGVPVSGAELLGAMDGYAKAIAGWSTVDPDAATVLKTLRDRGYRLGLLSNTWWAADWHNADLAMQGALEAGMRGIWRKNESGFPSSIAVPTAEVEKLSELPALLQKWGGA